MTGTSIKIEDQATPALSSLVRAASAPEAMMRDISGYMLFSTQRRFETETDPDGQKWQSLSKRTAAARVGRRRRGADNILRLTTRLYRSLTAVSDATSAQVGTNVEYAAIHQFGGVLPVPERQGRVTFKAIRGKRGVRFVKPGTKGATEQDVTIRAHSIRMPARAYLGINDSDRIEIETIAAESLRQETGL